MEIDGAAIPHERIEPDVRRAVGADGDETAELLAIHEAIELGVGNVAVVAVEDHCDVSTIRQKYRCTAAFSVSSGWKVPTRTDPCRARTTSPPWRASDSTPGPTRVMRGARMKTISMAVGSPSSTATPCASNDSRCRPYALRSTVMS